MMEYKMIFKAVQRTVLGLKKDLIASKKTLKHQQNAVLFMEYQIDILFAHMYLNKLKDKSIKQSQ